MKTSLIRKGLSGILLSVTLTAMASPPIAHDINMSPIVQSSSLLPLEATAVNTEIVMFTIETIPEASAGNLFLIMNGNPMAVTAGMMLSADLAGSLIFEPNQTFTGTAVFTYSAIDGNLEVSNSAHYNIPVVAQPAVILPVNLLGFSGRLDHHTAHLYWQTSQEQEGCYYELQRSVNGQAFQTIATLSGHGRAGVQDYAATDDLFFYASSKVYYRLRIVEVNGQARYSGQVLLSTGNQTSQPKAWPVPFNGHMQVSFQGIQNETIQVQLFAINGSLIKQMRMVTREGINTCQFSQLENLPSGQYIIQINSAKGPTRLQVTK